MKRTAILFYLLNIFLLQIHILKAENKNTDTLNISFKINHFNIDGKLLYNKSKNQQDLIIYVFGSGPTDIDLHIKYSKNLSQFSNKGYAVLLYNKPGSGESKGEFSKSNLIEQRTEILLAAIKHLDTMGDIKFKKIGLFGSSQAAYIMGPACKRSSNISFLIAYSCPMENTLKQSAYQIREYMNCASYSFELSEYLANIYIKREKAKTYRKYYKYAQILNIYNEIKNDLGFGGIVSEENFNKPNRNSEVLNNPSSYFKNLEIPILSLYGENDKNINPHQAYRFFQKLSKKNKNIKTLMIDNADHNMVVGGNGCIQDQLNGYSDVNKPHLSKVFLNLIDEWLSKI